MGSVGLKAVSGTVVVVGVGEIMHLYRTRNRDFINIVKDCPITEVYKYLPDEVLRMMIRIFEEINETEKKEAAIEAMEVKV